MPTTSRPLPPVIGSTETSLRALLESALSPTPVPSYRHWIALNVAPTAEDRATEVVSAALKADRHSTEQVLHDLSRAGLLTREAASWRHTAEGALLVQALRATISEMTERLVAELPAEDLDTTIDVLELIRARAEHELDQRALPPDPGQAGGGEDRPAGC